VGFVVDKVALAQVLVLRFSPAYGSVHSYSTWGINYRPVGGHTSETWSHVININNKILMHSKFLLTSVFLQFFCGGNEIIENYCFICIKNILQFIVFEKARQKSFQYSTVSAFTLPFLLNTNSLNMLQLLMTHKCKMYELVIQNFILNNMEVSKIEINPLQMENYVIYV
jgi:hypothetical protein